MTVSELMTTDLVTLRCGDTVDLAISLMLTRGLRALPVLDEDSRLLGVVTDSALVRLALPSYAELLGDLAFLPDDFEPFERRLHEAGDVRVEQILSGDIAVASEETSLIEAAWLMLRDNRRRLYVLRNGRLVGTLGLRDILREMLKA